MEEMRKPQIPHSTEISYKKKHAQFSPTHGLLYSYDHGNIFESHRVFSLLPSFI